MVSRIRMEGYKTLDGRSKSFAIGKTSKPPARRSRARGFVAFFIAAETLQFKRALASIRLQDGSRELGVLRPRKGRARLVGQESARLDLQKPTGAITRDELQKALLNQGVQRRRDETDDCTKLSDMQKLERIGCYRIDYCDETARGDQSGSGNYDGKTLRKGHPNSGLRALAKDGCRRNRSRAFESLTSIEQDGYYGGYGKFRPGSARTS